MAAWHSPMADVWELSSWGPVQNPLVWCQSPLKLAGGLCNMAITRMIRFAITSNNIVVFG